MVKKIILAAACVALVACSKKNSTDDPLGANAFQDGQQVTIGVGAGESSTKVVGTDDPTKDEIGFTWEKGDQILITVGDKISTFTLSSGVGTANAAFTGKMPASGSTFDIKYPVSDPDLGSQTYAEGGKLPAGKIAFEATDCSLDGYNELFLANSVLQLNLYGTSQTISKIVVTNISNESKPTYTLDISGGKTLGTTEDAATPFYIIMPNGEYKIGVEIFDNAETPASICSFTTSSEKEFGDSEGGGCVNMAAKEVGIPGPVGGGLDDINKTNGTW